MLLLKCSFSSAYRKQPAARNRRATGLAPCCVEKAESAGASSLAKLSAARERDGLLMNIREHSISHLIDPQIIHLLYSIQPNYPEGCSK